MTFTLVLVLILRYYDQIKTVNKEYQEAKELVSTVVIGFKSELERRDERVDDLYKEIMSLRAIKIKEPRSVNDDLILSEIENLKQEIEEVQKVDEPTMQELSEIREIVQGLIRTQSNVETHLETLDDQYRGLLPETEAEQIIPVKSSIAPPQLHTTELEILQMLITEGPMSAIEIREKIGKTREHVARLMKKLHDQRLVDRDEKKRPYLYAASQRVKKSTKEPSKKEETTETSS
jgi:chromosome segregation and condensation protein ScpB